MGILDITVAGVFTLLIVLLGLQFKSGQGDSKAFFAGGGQVPWWISGLSLFMSFFSVGTFVVWGAIAYSDGLVSVSIQMTMAISGFIIALFIAPAWNRQRVLTAAQFITRRVGLPTQKFYSATFLVMNLFTAGAFLYPVGKIIEVTTGINLNLAILLLGAFIILYTSVGGLWAVLTTDVLQFIVLTAAVLLIIPLSIDAAGGLTSFVDSVPDDFFNLTNDKYSAGFLVAFLIYNTLFIGGNWAYVQRYTSVPNERDAKKVGWLFGCLYLIAPIIWMLPPMLYRSIEPGLIATETENAYLLMSQQVLPTGLLGLVIGAMVFATASSVNTTINIAAGVFTSDVYPNLVKSQRLKPMVIARLSSATFGILAILVAMSVQSMGGIVNVVLSVAALTGAPLYLPPLWALFSKYQTGFSLVTVTISSLVINLSLKFLLGPLFDMELSTAEEMICGVFIPGAFLLIFECAYRLKTPLSILDSVNAARPEIIDERFIESGKPENTHALRVISVGILSIGFIILCLGFLTEGGRFETLTVGLIVFLVGVFLSRKARAASFSSQQQN